MQTSEKEALYKECLKIIKENVAGKSLKETMTFTCKVLKAKIPYYFWVGFYIPKKEYLELGPSEGPPACAQIAYSGVCGKCAETGKTIIVPNVNEFPGHIACDPRSKSEIAVPVRDKNGHVMAVLDVDSEEYGSFDATDMEWLERIVEILNSLS
ncbi:GAF domain-containing protein [Candidatus Bathyarchaeota archaeon]|nr:GAF domain-containing protein [Candidatus Bathyarchaeota archaeon]